MIRDLKSLVPLAVKRILRSKLSGRHMALPPEPRTFVLLAADYGNIGDLAITSAQRGFLARVSPQNCVVAVPISATREVIQSLRRQAQPGDLITIIGGGNMGSLYPDIEELRQLVIRSFPGNRIVCFPQTLDWENSSASQRALKKIRRVYASHADLHVFARESVSLSKLRALFDGCPTVRVGYSPDIVLHANAAALGATAKADPQGVLLCLRDDRERSLNNAQCQQLTKALSSAGLHVEITDTHAGGSRLSHEQCSRLLADKLNQFQSAQLVVTDRLHGMILAAITGTPCLVLPNSNHKIRQTWGDWLRDVPQIRFIELDGLSGIEDAIDQLLATPRRDPVAPVVDPSKFDALRQAVTAA